MNTSRSHLSPKNSLFWSIHSEGKEGLLAGTIHVSFPGYNDIVHPLLQALDEGCTAYFGETDMSDLSELDRSSMDVDWSGLDHFISAQRYRGYRKKIKQFTGLDLNHIRHLPPMFISSLIASRLIDGAEPSVDEVLWSKAQELDLTTGGLESVGEQMTIYSRIPQSYQLIQLKRMLGNLSKARKSIEKLVSHYRNQRIHELYRQGKSTLGPIRQLMLQERNVKIVDRIDEEMKAHDRVFFSAGAAHLGGKHGIIHGLKQKGFTVRPIRI